jgi:hypothetical protein
VQPIGHEQSNNTQAAIRMAHGLTPAGCEELPSRQVFIMTIVFILWGASALAGLVIGLAFIRVLAIVLASPLVAFLSVALLFHYGFELVHGVLISIGSLTALQGFYLAGTAISYLMSNKVDDDPVSSGETMMRKPAAASSDLLTKAPSSATSDRASNIPVPAKSRVTPSRFK